METVSAQAAQVETAPYSQVGANAVPVDGANAAVCFVVTLRVRLPLSQPQQPLLSPPPCHVQACY